MIVILPVESGATVGKRVDLNSVLYSLSGSVITFTQSAGGTFTYTDPQGFAPGALAVVQQMDRFRRFPLPNGQIAQLISGYFNLIDVLPHSMDIANIAQITVIGDGFSSTVQYYLCFNDTSGGIDGDPMYFACTFVSSTMLMAVFTGGATNMSAASNPIYLTDMVPNGSTVVGHLSNVLLCTGTGTVIASIP